MKRTVVRYVLEPPPSPYDAPVPAPLELPQAGLARGERIDAARNRAAILEAAERLLREQGPEAITMDRLACEAGVGKGTIFRRFGDRASLFHALLDESERRLQEGFIRGPAPLGPGAPPVERLIAFGHALLELTAERSDILLAAEPPDPALRTVSAVYGAYRAHVRALLEAAGMDHVDYLADALLAALSPRVTVRQLEQGLDLAECKRAWALLARRLLG